MGKIPSNIDIVLSSFCRTVVQAAGVPLNLLAKVKGASPSFGKWRLDFSLGMMARGQFFRLGRRQKMSDMR